MAERFAELLRELAQSSDAANKDWTGGAQAAWGVATADLSHKALKSMPTILDALALAAAHAEWRPVGTGTMIDENAAKQMLYDRAAELRKEAP